MRLKKHCTIIFYFFELFNADLFLRNSFGLFVIQFLCWKFKRVFFLFIAVLFRMHA